MKYMMLIYGAENQWTEAERAACVAESMRFGDELASRGKYLDSGPLQSVRTAATVRVRDGRPLVTDGPFAETTEQLGGYYVLDLADLDEAIAVAGRLPPAHKGAVEIRPLIELDGLPPARPHSAGPGTTPYLLLIYKDPAAGEPDPAAQKEGAAAAVALARDLDAAGAYLSAAPLHPPATATCVRVRDGKRLVTDGPFAETTEVLGGYFLIRAAGRGEAAAVATRFMRCCSGAVEVRPLFDLTGVRKSAPIP